MGVCEGWRTRGSLSLMTCYHHGCHRIDSSRPVLLPNLPLLTPPCPHAKQVPVRKQAVIYSLLDEVRDVLQDRMPSERVEESQGKLEVAEIFALTGKRKTKNRVAGCRVVAGKAFSSTNYHYRVLRDGTVLMEDMLPSSLYHFKESVTEVTKGMECGISLTGFGDFLPGDIIECYSIDKKKKDIREVFGF